MSKFNNINKKPSFLLYGGNGWIGTKVYDLLLNMGINVEKSSCRADDIEAVDNEIRFFSEIGLTHVMSFIGRTHGIYEGEEISTIDYLEKPGKLNENIKDNLYGPIILSSVCKKYGLHFTYLGTGCIFEYDNNHPCYSQIGFKEEDVPNFYGSSYSIVKGYTDRLMQNLFNDEVLNVRIRMPITSEVNPRNFITKITNYKKICSVPNSMTVLDNLLPVIIKYALENKNGTINFTNPGTITHNEILELYKEIVDNDFTWENFSINDQNKILASKRSNNFLDTTLLESEKNNSIKPIKEAIIEVLVKMKESKLN